MLVNLRLLGLVGWMRVFGHMVGCDTQHYLLAVA